MSHPARQHVMSLQGLTDGQFRVAMALADQHGKKQEGLCCPSVDTIAKIAEKSRRNTFRILSQLKGKVIQEVPRTSKYRSTHYEFIDMGGDTMRTHER